MKANIKYIFLAFLAVILLCRSAGFSQEKFGIGFVLGEPTGVTWKYKINSTNAIDGALGFSPFDRYRLHVDYLWQSLPFNERNLALHYGVGMAVGFGRTRYFAVDDGRRQYFLRDQEIGFGIRGVVGIDYRIQQSPVNLFFEVAPLVIVAPGGGMGIDVGLGVRFYP